MAIYVFSSKMRVAQKFISNSAKFCAKTAKNLQKPRNLLKKMEKTAKIR
jgi:hypothetical protein